MIEKLPDSSRSLIKKDTEEMEMKMIPSTLTFLIFLQHSFGSNDNAGGLYYTNSGEMVIRLEKPGPESHSYRFYIRVALQNGIYILHIGMLTDMITLKCVSIGTPKTINFPFVSN